MGFSISSLRNNFIEKNDQCLEQLKSIDLMLMNKELSTKEALSELKTLLEELNISNNYLKTFKEESIERLSNSLEFMRADANLTIQSAFDYLKKEETKLLDLIDKYEREHLNELEQVQISDTVLEMNLKENEFKDKAPYLSDMIKKLQDKTSAMNDTYRTIQKSRIILRYIENGNLEKQMAGLLGSCHQSLNKEYSFKEFEEHDLTVFLANAKKYSLKIECIDTNTFIVAAINNNKGIYFCLISNGLLSEHLSFSLENKDSIISEFALNFNKKIISFYLLFIVIRKILITILNQRQCI